MPNSDRRKMKNKQKVSSDKFTMMTQMPVNKLICKMAVPTIITMLVSAVYNMADTYFVGKIGTSATGAVGVVFRANKTAAKTAA